MKFITKLDKKVQEKHSEDNKMIRQQQDIRRLAERNKQSRSPQDGDQKRKSFEAVATPVSAILCF